VRGRVPRRGPAKPRKPGPRVACPRWTGAWPRGLCTPRWALVQLVQRSVGLYSLSSARYGARLYSAPSDGFTTIPVRWLPNHPCPTASQPSLSDGFTTIPVRWLPNHPCPTASQPSLSDGFPTIPVRRLHNHPCPTEHAHRVVHVRTAAGTRAAAEGGANGQCMPLPLLAHAQAEGQGRPAVAHNASFWRSTRLRLSSLAAGA